MDLIMTEMVEEQASDVAAFLVGNRWPYHQKVVASYESVHDQLADGWLTRPGTRTFWICTGQQRCGLLRVFDRATLFDLRLAEGVRGRGIGSAAVRWLTAYVFEQFVTLNRIEATTRVDNAAMRRALEGAGWV